MRGRQDVTIAGVANCGRLLLGLLLAAVATAPDAVQAQGACTMPNGRQGQCVNYMQCPRIVQWIDEIRNQDQRRRTEFLNYLNSIRCPFGGQVVCCEANSNGNANRRQPFENDLGLNERGMRILSATRCGYPPDIKVSFGNVTKLSEFPWMALIRYNTPEQFNCGGSLITNRYVLTAAHCVTGLPQGRVVLGVRLGEHDLSKEQDCGLRGSNIVCAPPVEDVGIERIVAHPEWRTITNDIALLRLNRDVEFKEHIKPICLPITARSRQVQHEEFFVAGWGTTDQDSRANVLMKALIPYQPLSFCRQRWSKNANLITDKHICAGGVNRVNSCKGDSGGPIFFLKVYQRAQRYIQYGLVSYGSRGCGELESLPTVFTKVEAHLHWIANNIE